MKIKHSKRKSEKVILPQLGEVLLDENGEIEVPDVIGEILLQGKNWVDTAAKIDDPGDTTKDTAEGEKGLKSTSEDEKEQMIALVKEMPHDELLALAEQSKINGAKLFKKPEKLEVLRKLVINHIKRS
jgi:hypothetical protein